LDSPAVIADPAIPIMWHGRALISEMAGSSLVKPGHDHLVEVNLPYRAITSISPSTPDVTLKLRSYVFPSLRAMAR
jgi:hypothetical protein